MQSGIENKKGFSDSDAKWALKKKDPHIYETNILHYILFSLFFSKHDLYLHLI